MALNTYSDLKTAIGDWLHRGDLAARAADFIALAELRFTRQITLSEFVPLSDANPTNWMLTNAPSVYLYGALLEASAYLLDDERIPLWKQAFDNAVFELQSFLDRTKYPDSPLRIRPDRPAW